MNAYACPDCLLMTSLNCEIYVTDSPSGLQEDWGTPVAAGTWPDDQEAHDVIFAAPKNGQFVILYAATGYGGEVSAAEVWVYGGAPMTFLSVFSLVDQSTRHSYITDSPIVDVTLEGDGGVAPYLFIIDDDNSVKPNAADLRWAAAPASIDLTTFFGELTEDATYTLYAWTKDAGDLVSDAKAHTMVYKTSVAMFEIPKSQMTASANNVRSDDPNFAASRAINGSATDIGWLAEITNGWLKLDLGDRYQVQRFDYNPRPTDAQGRIKDYEIYVTDVDSFSKDDWGTPVAAGTFLNENSRQTVTFASPKNGRYVILYAVSSYASGQSGASEVWIFGDAVANYVQEFVLADKTSGSNLYTNADSVNVTLAGGGGTEPYQFIIDGNGDTKPAASDPRWGNPASVSLSAFFAPLTNGEDYTLYAWVLSGTTATSASATILFSTAAPAVSDVLVTDNGNGTATAAWTTDIPAEGALTFTRVTGGATPVSVPEGTLGTAHSVQFDIEAGANYKIVLINNEIASPGFYWPQLWPISGDANGDCRVNILDLIYIRNRLNQDINTGDNIKADVNLDGRINILDLIFVRNRLNTACP